MMMQNQMSVDVNINIIIKTCSEISKNALFPISILFGTKSDDKHCILNQTRYSRLIYGVVHLTLGICVEILV